MHLQARQYYYGDQYVFALFFPRRLLWLCDVARIDLSRRNPQP